MKNFRKIILLSGIWIILFAGCVPKVYSPKRHIEIPPEEELDLTLEKPFELKSEEFLYPAEEKKEKSPIIIAFKIPPEISDIDKSKLVTRAELAALLTENLDIEHYPSILNTPIIIDITNHWARDYIRKINRIGLMKPFPNHTFLPDSFITRSELAKVTSKILRLEGAAKKLKKGDVKFNDVPNTNYYYNDIILVTSTNIMDTFPDGTFKPLKNTSGQEMLETIDRLKEFIR